MGAIKRNSRKRNYKGFIAKHFDELVAIKEELQLTATGLAEYLTEKYELDIPVENVGVYLSRIKKERQVQAEVVEQPRRRMSI